MDNQISVDWNTITGVFDRAEILDNWCAHPSVWEVAGSLQHSQHVLAMVHYTLPSTHKGKPAIIYGALFISISTHQAQTSLSPALVYLKHGKEDCFVLVSTPAKPKHSPQPWRGKYLILPPINSDQDVDRRP